MPRRLPWKTSPSSPSVVKSPKVKHESPRPTASRSPSVAASSFTKPRRPRVAGPELLRSPSTSPPPEPPKEQFMIPGPLDDDRYRMVEDEFINIAHQFTAHIHRAEYNRLKALAKSQNAATIREIERPVVGTPTRLARYRQESVKRALKQRKLNGNAAADDDDLPRIATGLRGLLESPRKEAKWISSGAGGAPTRASAGYRSSLTSPPKPHRKRDLFSSTRKRPLEIEDDEESTDDDGDLATPRRIQTTRPVRTTPTSVTTASRSSTWPAPSSRGIASSPLDRSKPSTTSRPKQTPSKPGPSRISRHQVEDNNDEDDDDDPFGVNRRRIQRQKSKDQLRKPQHSEPAKKRSLDTIPTFL